MRPGIKETDCFRKDAERSLFILLPVSEGGVNLKTTDINRLIETLGVKSLPNVK